MSQVQGFPCPKCAHTIQVPTEILLGFRDRLFCSGCGLELTINRENSQEALEQYKHLHETIEKAKGDVQRAEKGRI